MSKSTLLISQEAITDLETIWKHERAKGSLKDADVLYTHLIVQLKKIARNFTIGKSIESVRDGYRFFQVAEFYMYYRADLENQVEVIRILKKA